MDRDSDQRIEVKHCNCAIAAVVTGFLAVVFGIIHPSIIGAVFFGALFIIAIRAKYRYSIQLDERWDRYRYPPHPRRNRKRS